MTGTLDLQWYKNVLERVTAGNIEVGHVPDLENPSDLPKHKLNKSLEYATNSKAIDPALARRVHLISLAYVDSPTRGDG